MWVVTNLRIIDIEQHGFFNRSVTTIPIEHIQDATVDVEGIFNTFLDIGTIKIESAGPTKHVTSFEGVRDPSGLKTIILSSFDHQTSKDIMTGDRHDILGSRKDDE
jgi:hypothetical protein